MSGPREPIPDDDEVLGPNEEDDLIDAIDESARSGCVPAAQVLSEMRALIEQRR